MSRKRSKTWAWTVQYWEYFIGYQGLLPWLIHNWKEKTSLWIEFTINPIRLIKIVVKKRKSSCAKPQNILNFKPINAKHFTDVHIRTTFLTLHNINTIKAYIYKKHSIFLDVGNGNNRKFPWINIKLYKKKTHICMWLLFDYNCTKTPALHRFTQQVYPLIWFLITAWALQHNVHIWVWTWFTFCCSSLLSALPWFPIRKRINIFYDNTVMLYSKNGSIFEKMWASDWWKCV